MFNNRIIKNVTNMVYIIISLPLLVNGTITNKQDQIAKALNFVHKPDNKCKGHYLEKFYNNSLSEIQITANSAQLLDNNISLLSGNVEALYADKKLTAEKAKVYPDSSTKKIKKLELFNSVKLISNNVIINGQYANIKVTENTGIIKKATYRLSPNIGKKNLNSNFSYGIAKQIIQEEKNIFNCKSASYTTCSPYVNSWNMRSSSVVIDREKQMIYAKNTVFYIKDIPVFYFPYFSFPIDGSRKSGFLYPSLEVSRLNFKLPYYFNLAPNYDATITSEFINRHGVNFSGEFRHLTKMSSTKLNIAYLPSDKTFKNNPELSGYMKNSRGKIDYTEKVNFNDNLSGKVDLHLVSDNKYLEDFNNSFNTISSNILSQTTELNYSSPHWKAGVATKTFQILDPSQQPYSILPKIYANTEYTNVLNFLNIENETEYVNFFNMSKNLTDRLKQIHRLHTKPSIELDLKKDFGFIRPKISLHTTFYRIPKFTSQPNSDTPSKINRLVPIYTVDTGLILERSTKQYSQLLKPRLMYSFIPMKEQNQIPAITSAYKSITYNNLFSSNRLSGIDRVGDTNKLTYGLTTEIKHQKKPLLSAGIGQATYFENRKVTICTTPNCSDQKYSGYAPLDNRFSPISSFLSVQINNNIRWHNDIAYFYSTGIIYSFNSVLQIKPSNRNIFNFSYSHIKNGEQVVPTLLPTDNTKTLHQLNTSGYFSISPYWSLYGAMSYNINEEYFRHYLTGLEYNSCCWAMRLLGGRAYTRQNSDNDPEFEYRLYIQFVLKGLGSNSNNDIVNLLNTHIPGFKDHLV
jgi:LPS-assembly protein